MKNNTKIRRHQSPIDEVIKTIIEPLKRIISFKYKEEPISMLKDFEAAVNKNAVKLAQKALSLYEIGEVPDMRNYLWGCVNKIFTKVNSQFYRKQERLQTLNEELASHIACPNSYFLFSPAHEALEILQLSQTRLSKDAIALIEAFLDVPSFNAARIAFGWNKKKLSRIQRQIKIAFSAYRRGEQ